MAPDGGKDTGTAAAFAGEENPTPPERESCWEEPAQQCLASSVLSHHEWWLFFCLGKVLSHFTSCLPELALYLPLNPKSSVFLQTDLPQGAAGWDAGGGNYSGVPPI